MELVHQLNKTPNVRHSLKTIPVPNVTTPTNTTLTITTSANNTRVTAKPLTVKRETVQNATQVLPFTMDNVWLMNNPQAHCEDYPQPLDTDFTSCCISNVLYFVKFIVKM